MDLIFTWEETYTLHTLHTDIRYEDIYYNEDGKRKTVSTLFTFNLNDLKSLLMNKVYVCVCSVYTVDLCENRLI